MIAILSFVVLGALFLVTNDRLDRLERTLNGHIYNVDANDDDAIGAVGDLRQE
jgi:hypothetical protein